MSRGPEHDVGHAPSAARAEVAQAPRTPAEQAADAIIGFTRGTGELRSAIAAVREARAANDLERWNEVHAQLQSMLAVASRGLERARAQSADASVEHQRELEAAAQLLDECRAAAAQLDEAPTGFHEVRDERELLAVFAAPLAGGVKVGLDRKEATLKERFDRLAPAERRVLAQRLERRRPNDPIAAAFARLGADRQHRLLAYLTSAPQRQAQQLARARGGEAAPVTSPGEAQADATATTEADAPAVLPEPEPLDAKLRRILETADSDAALASMFADLADGLDGTTRRALAKRLESYRPGTGDELAARFARHDRAVKQRIWTSLRAEVPGPQLVPAEVRGDLETATGMSLGHVNVHAGAAGAEVADAHGARAVAIGSDLYFGEGELDAKTVDGRELIAHEVAHVAQARAIAGPAQAAAKRDGDREAAAEVEADDFAARFRQEGAGLQWTPTVAVDSATPQHAPAVAKQPAASASKTLTAEAYLGKHEARLWRTVEAYLQQVSYPAPAPRLTWVNDAAFVAATVGQLRKMHLFARREALVEVLYPAEPYELLAPLLPPNDVWVPTVGSALAQLFEQPIASSLRRLGSQWVALAEHRPEQAGVNDETKSMVAAPSLIASAPIDLAVRQGLTVAAVVELQGNAKTSKPPRELRPVSVSWQGSRDRALWNWVYPSREDATAEEVAAALWPRDGRAGWDGPATYYAYGLERVGSLFRVPPSWARAFPDASTYAPVLVADETASSQFIALADSKVGDELALAQVGTAGKSKRPPELGLVLDKLDDASLLLWHLKDTLTPWQLDRDVDVAARWVAKKQAELAAGSPDDVRKWAPVIDTQVARLIQIRDGVKRVTDGTKGQDPRAASAQPVRRVLTAYARAAGTSFIGDMSARLVDAAEREQLATTLTALRATTNDLSAVVGNGRGVDAAQVNDAEQIARESRVLQTQLVAGQAISRDDLELTMLRGQELTLRVRVDQARHQIAALKSAAAAVGKGTMSKIVAAFNGTFRDVDSFASAFDGDLQVLLMTWDVESSGADLIKDPADHALASRKYRKSALINAQGAFARLAGNKDYVWFLRHGAEAVQRHAEITAWASICAQLLVMIGVGFAASAVGGLVTRTLAGWGARGQAIESASILARGGRVLQRGAATATGLAVEASVNTAGQYLVQGPPKDGALFATWLENAITGTAGSLLLGRIAHDLEFAKDIARQTHSMWARVKTGGAVVLAKGVTVSSHAIFNIAVAHVARKISHAGDAQVSSTELSDALMQGLSIGLGRYIQGTISNRRTLYKKLAQIEKFHAAKHLLRDADTLLRLAAKAETAQGDDLALALLGSQRRLLADELAVLEAAAADPAKRKALELSEATMRGASRFAREQLVSLDSKELTELPLHQAGLREIVEGQWKGTRAQVVRAIAAAKRAGITVSGKPNADGTWTGLTLGGRQITIHERSRRAARAPDKATSSSPRSRQVDPQQAAASLSTIAVLRLPVGGKSGRNAAVDRDTYYVSREDGARMIDLLSSLPDVRVRTFAKGFLVRRDDGARQNEWYFEFHDRATATGARSTDERGVDGLPPSNAATVEIWGFRGVRTINGRTRDQWSALERAAVERVKEVDPLLYAGHVGISVDGGKTIYGFTPDAPKAMPIPELLQKLMLHDAYPGVIGDDTSVFHRATQMAAIHGWNTEPLSAVELVDKGKKLEVAAKVAELSGMKPGEHGLGYSFPLERATGGEHFATSNGFSGSCVRNCASFPEKLGVEIPERSGNLRQYMPELQKWSEADAPMDFRTKSREGEGGDE